MLVGGGDYTDKYQNTSSNVRVVPCAKDKEVLKHTIKEIDEQTSKLVISRFHDLRAAPDKAAQRDMHERMDKAVRDIHRSLTPNMFFLVFTGNGDLREIKEQERQKYGKGEWTEQQEYHLRDLIQKARNGLAWITVKTK